MRTKRSTVVVQWVRENSGSDVSMGWQEALLVQGSFWEFPKTGDPNIVITVVITLNSRILVIRTPKLGTSYFRKLLSGFSSNSPEASRKQATILSTADANPEP